jgi:hypothetical protein
MSGSCCAGSSKSGATKVAMEAAPQTSEAAAERPTEKSRKSECCNDKQPKSGNSGCNC